MYNIKTNIMNEYLLLFRNIGGDGGYISTPEEMAKDLPEWQGWIGNIAMQGKLIATHPIEYYGTIVSNSGIGSGPLKDTHKVLVSGYLICRAESDEEVISWSKTCPILKYAESSVEIRPVIPFPID